MDSGSWVSLTVLVAIALMVAHGSGTPALRCAMGLTGRGQGMAGVPWQVTAGVTSHDGVKGSSARRQGKRVSSG